ncbi:MAG: lantibiotic dehydratase C-terminal domain-containing protein, partial [bacterium]|nr:lantibiotic dehydratase C-terminal domain-containing protein [bacterium]
VPYHQTLWISLKNKAVSEPAWLAEWLRRMGDIGDELRKTEKEGLLKSPPWFESAHDTSTSDNFRYLWKILESYVHMTNNRLGILNQDEGYLGYLIKMSLEAIMNVPESK